MREKIGRHVGVLGPIRRSKSFEQVQNLQLLAASNPVAEAAWDAWLILKLWLVGITHGVRIMILATQEIEIGVVQQRYRDFRVFKIRIKAAGASQVEQDHFSSSPTGDLLEIGAVPACSRKDGTYRTNSGKNSLRGHHFLQLSCTLSYTKINCHAPHHHHKRSTFGLCTTSHPPSPLPCVTPISTTNSPPPHQPSASPKQYR
ncbi:hypothetical protein PsorP6_001344 [Peronosclerospora sorghi]|uniref:Uncharacterized protein n=1 Tax=Peronosclerospora sorghi TaxID=230839 RepID=A0ACC0WSP7_9STRA|nr:hypothetical protein PsorP6_001344 [Peronosclerospora sorghi]